MKNLIKVALVVVAVLIMANVAFAGYKDYEVTIRNNTLETIFYVHATHVDQADWGECYLDESEVIINGESRRITISGRDSIFDFAVQSETNTIFTRRDIDVDRIKTIIFRQAHVRD